MDLITGIVGCSFPVGPKALPHSEIMRLCYDEGYAVEPAQGMAYDADSVSTHEARIDTFHTDWFDAAEISQRMRMSSPVATPVPTSVEESNDVKKDDKIPNPAKDDE
ncbi:hypothetical protein [Dipodfec virus UOA04_Rod_626]|nr:hypothetical protein [Dipodfec virus UOA04_Rod_626]